MEEMNQAEIKARCKMEYTVIADFKGLQGYCI
jgi:hypothetical protein